MNESNKGAATIPPPPPTIAEEKRSWADWVTGVGGPLIGLVLLCVIFSLTTDVFLTWRNSLNVIDQITVLGILAIGMTAVIVIGGIDLSVGSILAFSMMMMGWLFQTEGVPLGLAIVAGLLVGTAYGLVNGLLITRAKLPPFIATSDDDVGRPRLANIITDGRQIVGFPDWFTNLSTVRHFGFLSVTVACSSSVDHQLGCSPLHHARPQPLCDRRKRGGGAARRHPVRQLTMSVYALSGVGWLASVALACRLNSSQPSAGLGYELDTHRGGGHRRREPERRRRRDPRNRRRRL